MSEHTQQVDEQPDEQAKGKVRKFSTGTVLVAVGSLMMVGATAFFIGLAAHRGSQVQEVSDDNSKKDEQIRAQSDQNQLFADRLLVFCADPRYAKEYPSVCQAAVEVKKQAEPAPATGPSDYDVLQQLVDTYMANHPPKDGHTPTPEELVPVIRPVVQQVFKNNPPKDGHTPTDAELLTLIRMVYAENPPAPGKDGQNAYCFDHPEDTACQPRDGKDGDQGPQGLSIVQFGFQPGDDGSCQLFEVVRDPSGAQPDQKLTVGAPDVFCAPAQPPPETTTTTTEPSGVLGG